MARKQTTTNLSFAPSALDLTVSRFEFLAPKAYTTARADGIILSTNTPSLQYPKKQKSKISSIAAVFVSFHFVSPRAASFLHCPSPATGVQGA
jgi:hypothetical protein